jgi:hypothetical protein
MARPTPTPTPAGSRPGYKGNKAALPSKPCMACGRPMSWRKAWAKNWAEVRYCSDACRRTKAGNSGGPR